MIRHIISGWLLSIAILPSTVGQEMPTSWFTDPRDGQLYETIQIKDRVWFRENLRYETPKSYCPNDNKREDECDQGNFYVYTEVDTLCPEGWRLATNKDWEAYFDWVQFNYEVEDDDLTYYAYPSSHVNLKVEDVSKSIQLFATDNPLNLQKVGWVQGKKHYPREQTTIWINEEDSDDDRYHIHLSDAGYIKHTHWHHINVGPPKMRRFLVRCVKDATGE